MPTATLDLTSLEEFYKNRLLENTVPFWFPRSYDRDYGGFLLMRDADGSLIDDDKAVWIQGRATWLLATLYNSVKSEQEWLEGARPGYDFLIKFCCHPFGRMCFHVADEGLPLRIRRSFFSEAVLDTAGAAHPKATPGGGAAEPARDVFGKCLEYST